jgi:hypothetical protein
MVLNFYSILAKKNSTKWLLGKNRYYAIGVICPIGNWAKKVFAEGNFWALRILQRVTVPKSTVT